jgi:hypothetical protein
LKHWRNPENHSIILPGLSLHNPGAITKVSLVCSCVSC